ncbi:MAG TPA: hypothetical protein VGK97_00245 [Spongiibacteraceae bacterium]
MKKFLFPLLSVAAATSAFANETTVCTAHGDQRVIELITDEPGCKVNYTKGGETKTLWSSARAEYCAPHAVEFIEKQKGWGYECTAKTDQAASPAQ